MLILIIDIGILNPQGSTKRARERSMGPKDLGNANQSRDAFPAENLA